ncbi:MAG: 4Fe-4S dicluster domain-containing protein [Actinomycetota bacterium]|jgi:molybdopterin-containing oxidoreductase family iron-sulfur binding subunit|nr:4Fe-4S dicluster domain-containing protein [Actinomycetota bacterium]MDA8357266.1 4Fe-4S dicluster domain-containing protein [Actinomycetota bacterium]
MSSQNPAQEGNAQGPAPSARVQPVTVTTGQRVSRRRFLGAAASGVGLAAVGSVSGVVISRSTRSAAAPGNTAADAAAKSTAASHQWAMVIDLRYCNGCKLCTAACERYHYLHEDQTWIHVFTMQSASGQQYFMPRPCMMCEDPPCVPVCPVSANFRTAEGLVLVTQQRCIGTRICMNACPYQARYFNWNAPVPAPRQPFPQEPAWPVPQVEGTVGKCVFCAAMLPSGRIPECAGYCPMGVIYMGDLESDVAVNGIGNSVTLSKFLAENTAVRFKTSFGTHPRVWYVTGHGQTLDTDKEVA